MAEKEIEKTGIKRSGRAVFSSKFAAIATSVGSAVGLGNIWRFPYEAGVHGGAAFIICYLFFVFLIGIPILCAEFAIGRNTRSNIFGAYRKLRPGSLWPYTGMIGIIASVLIISFYSVVAGWTLEYCVESLFGHLNFSDKTTGHAQFLNLTTGWRPVVWTIIFLICNGILLMGGVKKGIEKASNFMTPLLFVMLIGFCIYSFSLPGFNEGMAFLFNPDFSKITPSVLLGAMGQAFFSLSLGLGCLMTYASYFNKETSLLRTAITTGVLDTMVAILAGIIIFPAVFSFGLSPSQGPTLVFEVLPFIFTHMSGGGILSFCFFLLLLIASLTSTVSISEISISYFEQEKGLSRKKATIISTLIGICGAILCALSFGALKDFTICGLTIFNLFDYVSSNILLPSGALLCSIFIGWIIKRRLLAAELGETPGKKKLIVSLLVFALRWICPVGIIFIFLNSIGII